EKVLFIIDITVFISRNVIDVEIRYAEHFPCTFCICPGNNWSVHVEELVLIKELVNGETFSTSYYENRTEKISTDTKMHLFAKNFKGMFFWLKNGFVSFFGKIVSQDLNFLCNNLDALSGSLTFYHFTNNFQ